MTEEEVCEKLKKFFNRPKVGNLAHDMYVQEMEVLYYGTFVSRLSILLSLTIDFLPHSVHHYKELPRDDCLLSWPTYFTGARRTSSNLTEIAGAVAEKFFSEDSQHF